LLGSFRLFQRWLAQVGQEGIQAWVQVFKAIQDRLGNLYWRHILPTNLRRDIAQRSK
jgi:hypothetical protein